MLKVLIDTNVIIDHLTNREPFCEFSEKVIRLCENKKIRGYITASSATDIYYILRKYVGREKGIEFLRLLVSIIDVIEVTKSDILKAMEINISDYEDALLSCCASKIKADYIITRNAKDFLNSNVNSISPKELLDKNNF